MSDRRILPEGLTTIRKSKRVLRITSDTDLEAQGKPAAKLTEALAARITPNAQYHPLLVAIGAGDVGTGGTLSTWFPPRNS